VYPDTSRTPRRLAQFEWNPYPISRWSRLGRHVHPPCLRCRAPCRMARARTEEKLLPCCCGANCTDTRAFTEAANLNKSEDFLDICRAQLKGSNIPFEKLDYGIDPGSRAHQFWHHLGAGGKAGFVIGVVTVVVIGVSLVLFWIYRCQESRRRRERRYSTCSWERNTSPAAENSPPPSTAAPSVYPTVIGIFGLVLIGIVCFCSNLAGLISAPPAHTQ
jgi:hypothetical protein